MNQRGKREIFLLKSEILRSDIINKWLNWKQPIQTNSSLTKIKRWPKMSNSGSGQGKEK